MEKRSQRGYEMGEGRWVWMREEMKERKREGKQEKQKQEQLVKTSSRESHLGVRKRDGMKKVSNNEDWRKRIMKNEESKEMWRKWRIMKNEESKEE